MHTYMSMVQAGAGGYQLLVYQAFWHFLIPFALCILFCLPLILFALKRTQRFSGNILRYIIVYTCKQMKRLLACPMYTILLYICRHGKISWKIGWKSVMERISRKKKEKKIHSSSSLRFSFSDFFPSEVRAAASWIKKCWKKKYATPQTHWRSEKSITGCIYMNLCTIYMSMDCVVYVLLTAFLLFSLLLLLVFCLELHSTYSICIWYPLRRDDWMQ